MRLNRLLRLASAVVVALTLSFTLAAPAYAGDDVGYENEEVDPGNTGSEPDGGSGGEPACNQTAEYPVCFGDVACWVRDPAMYQGAADELGPPPEEGAEVAYRQCENGDLEWYWSDTGGPSLEDRIRSARGALRIPAYSATYNPPGRTLVNLPTWWWAGGLPDGEIVGSEALGLVAIGTRRSMSVTPGDGHTPIACPFTTVKSDACAYTYRRSSGSGTYPASVTVVYDVRFEEDGAIVDIPAGVPADLLTIERTENVAVRVAEVQSRVTGTR